MMCWQAQKYSVSSVCTLELNQDVQEDFDEGVETLRFDVTNMLNKHSYLSYNNEVWSFLLQEVFKDLNQIKQFMLIDNGSVRTSHPNDLESDSHLLSLLLVFLVLQILQLLYERIPKVIEGIFMDWINRNYLIFFLVFFLLQLLILDFIVNHKVNKNLQ